MNIANKFTIARLILVPVFVIAYYLGAGESNRPAIIFIIASLTDAIDGHLARSRNLITTFGKFVDPLADKILTMSAFVLLTWGQIIPARAVIVIIARELAITGFRTIAASQNITIAAGQLGKIKTATQMVAIVCLLFVSEGLNKFGLIVFYVAVFFTILSGVDYIVKNKKVLDLDNI